MSRIRPWRAVWSLIVMALPMTAQSTGSLRGQVSDKDVGGALSGARVQIVELGKQVLTNDQGAYVVAEVVPGRYTVIISRDGYVRWVRTDVAVVAGILSDLDASLAPEYTELEEFVVQDDALLTPGSEAALLNVRFESPSLLSAISSDLISRAGASDAAAAMRLVAGASVVDGKFAVIRGLPDRYVSSQLNGVRLPSADDETRAVELDQFPSNVIESLIISKTFTPDQQGDASGGAVNVLLRGVPEEPLFIRFSSQISLNTQVSSADRFLTYDGGGLTFFGDDDGERSAQIDSLGGNWTGAAGVTPGDAPIDHKWALSVGASHDIGGGFRIGALASLFYERDSSYFDGGFDDSYWVETPGGPLVPRVSQGSVSEGDFKSNLFDVTRAAQSVQWGALASLGIQSEDHSLKFVYLYTRTAEDESVLAEDTRGKEFYFPGHDPSDPTTPGHEAPDSAPYLRLETLQYTERTIASRQLSGHHRLPTDRFGLAGLLEFGRPELDWIVAFSDATSHQPDKRQFGSLWVPEREVIPGVLTIPAFHRPYKPAANFTLGNLQRIFTDIEESSEQYHINLKLPFEQWTETAGALRVGIFSDSVQRTFDQETFSNFNDNQIFEAGFDQFWSGAFPFEEHPITASDFDVDYRGQVDIVSWYAMLELPILPSLKLVGGVRFESTDLSIVNIPDPGATWFPPNSPTQVLLNPGDADVAYQQDDVLPSISLEWRPLKELTVRLAYNETIARQTFREVSPILQQEFLGGPIFIGNPELRMSALKNYDIRVDYVPYEGGLISAAWFLKDIEDAIENVQRVRTFDFTTAVNYPKGRISGFEFEVRQSLGRLWDPLEGLSFGANATFIESEVTLPADESAAFNLPNILEPMTSRDATNAPEHLFNFFVTYDLTETQTQFALFYTIQGETLVAGAGESNGNFVPSLYTREFDTLNFSLSQRLGKHFRLQFQAKNLTNPDIGTFYRSSSRPDQPRTSSKAGVEFSLSVSADFKF